MPLEAVYHALEGEQQLLSTLATALHAEVGGKAWTSPRSSTQGATSLPVSAAAVLAHATHSFAIVHWETLGLPAWVKYLNDCIFGLLKSGYAEEGPHTVDSDLRRWVKG